MRDNAGTSARALETSVHTYRADIDGLRAVAILGVMAFHFGLGGVTGGYGGVDVFFVISGFLIAGIIKSELEAGTFSLANFYVRRVRRIVPILAVSLLATTIAAGLILFPRDFHDYLQSLSRASLAISNFYFERKADDYFGGKVFERPLLHTWSLSIEEQFYAVFPLLVMLLFRFKRAFIVPAMAMVAVVSLAYSMRSVSEVPAEAFFSTYGRVWELLFGTLLAFGLFPRVRSAIVREGEALLGAAMIGWCYFSYTASTPFPGLAAVPFCLGAVLIIHAGIGSGTGGDVSLTTVGRLLASTPAVAVGKISYSVYLWHWPLLALARYRYPDMFGAELSLQAGLALCALSLALGTLSWRFIETPFRRISTAKNQWKAYAPELIMVVLLAGGAQLVVRKPGWLQTWSPEIVRLDTADLNTLRQPTSFGVPPPAQQGWASETRILGSGPEAEDALLWGDSHAIAILPGLNDYVEKTGKRIVVAARPGCPPLIGVSFVGSRPSRVCEGFNDRTLDALLHSKIKRVLLAARWTTLENSIQYQDGRAVSRRGKNLGSEAFGPVLEATVKTLVEHGKDVVVMGPIPEPKFDVIRISERHVVWGEPLPPEQTLQTFLDSSRRLLLTLAQLDETKNVHVVYPHLRLCADGKCRYRKDGELLYLDANHLNAVGAGKLGDMYAEFFASRPHLTTAASP